VELCDRFPAETGRERIGGDGELSGGRIAWVPYQQPR
jgi:hypothetical protein